MITKKRYKAGYETFRRLYFKHEEAILLKQYCYLMLEKNDKPYFIETNEGFIPFKISKQARKIIRGAR